VVHACNPSYSKVEVIQGQPEQSQQEILSGKNKLKVNKQNGLGERLKW
jgi:hypothetical protein